MRRLDLIFGGFFAVACLVAAAVHYWPSQQAQARFGGAKPDERWGKSYLPNLPVVDQNGKSYHFYDDLIKGKKVVINFIFASCSDICPLMSGRTALLQKRLEDILGRDTFIYSITIDPEHDGPKELKRYADTFRAGPGWLFLTGKPEDIAVIREKLGERSGNIISNHRNEWLLGNPETHTWYKNGIFEDLEEVAMNVRMLDPNYRLRIATPGTSKANPAAPDADALKPATYTAHIAPGQTLFLKMCAMCHTIGQGDFVGPDLIHVRTRHNLVWLTSFMKDPPAMIRRGDPEALALLKKYPAVRMPNVGVSEQDAMDLLEYIDAESKLADAAAGKRASNEAQQEEPKRQSN